MDILRVQDLIKEGRITKLTDIDPTKAYLQYGLFQSGNRQNNASNADTYKSYVIPLSQLIGTPFIVNNKNFIGVDPVYGNDAQALASGSFNPNDPYKTVAAAVAAAGVAKGATVLLYPGVHNTGTIFNPNCDFYMMEGAQLTNAFGTVFHITAGHYLKVAGHGQIITGGFVAAAPTILFSGGNGDIECDLIQHNGVFWGPLFVEGGSQVTVRAREILAAGNNNSAITVTDGPFAPGSTSYLNLHAERVSHNWFAYGISRNAKFYAEVKETILWDSTGPLNFYGAFILCVNDAVNTDIRFSGDFYSNATLDVTSLGCGVVTYWNNSGGSCVITGTKSQLGLNQMLLIDNSPTTSIVVKTDLINTQGISGANGVGAVMNTGTLNIRGKLSTGLNPVDPAVQYNGGNLILDDAVLIANPVSQSIAAPAPITYKCYTGFANAPINVNATNSILGTAVIVDPGVE